MFTKKGFEKMKGFKKVTAVVLSAAMIIGSTMTAFAAETDGSTTSATGTGNILDYKIQSQVLPTSLKVAINPNGYKVNLRYAKIADDAAYDANTKYYTESSGTYSVYTGGENGFNEAKNNLYTAAISQDKIISFNYGIVNKSTVDRTITVKLDVTADSDVEFVSTTAKATNEAAADDGGAKVGEYKVYLALYPAKAGETITAYDGTTIDGDITGASLADVDMKKGGTPIVFGEGKGTTYADVAYKLGAATYELKDNEFIDFSTTSSGIADKFELTAIGGMSGFTIGGTMNTNTEWSQLETKTITIVPTYKLEDSTGLETAVSGGLNQVTAAARNNTVTYNANYSGANPATATETFELDGHPTGVSDAITALKTREGYTFEGWFDAAEDGNEVTITELTASKVVYAHWTAIQDTAPSIETTEYTMVADTAIEIAVDLGSGSKVATEVSSVVWSETELLGTDFASYADGKVTIPASAVNNLMGISGDQALTIKFNDTDETTVQVTLKH